MVDKNYDDEIFAERLAKSGMNEDQARQITEHISFRVSQVEKEHQILKEMFNKFCWSVNSHVVSQEKLRKTVYLLVGAVVGIIAMQALKNWGWI